MKSQLNTTSEINKLVKKLNIEQQNELLKNLRRQVLLDMARNLQGSILPNNITVKDIVKEVNLVRKMKNETTKTSH